MSALDDRLPPAKWQSPDPEELRRRPFTSHSGSIMLVGPLIGRRIA